MIQLNSTVLYCRSRVHYSVAQRYVQIVIRCQRGLAPFVHYIYDLTARVVCVRCHGYMFMFIGVFVLYDRVSFMIIV